LCELVISVDFLVSLSIVLVIPILSDSTLLYACYGAIRIDNAVSVCFDRSCIFSVPIAFVSILT